MKLPIVGQNYLTNGIKQCFSTFWAVSPGKRKIFKLLSRSKKKLLRYYLSNIFLYSKTPINVGFALIIVQNVVLLTKLDN